MARLRLFAQAREAAGSGRVEIAGDTVGAVIESAEERFGDGFVAVVAASQIWVNGNPADRSAPVGEDDEIAVLPPVSGG